jgi:hypothetical protein
LHGLWSLFFRFRGNGLAATTTSKAPLLSVMLFLDSSCRGWLHRFARSLLALSAAALAELGYTLFTASFAGNSVVRLFFSPGNLVFFILISSFIAFGSPPVAVSSVQAGNPPAKLTMQDASEGH